MQILRSLAIAALVALAACQSMGAGTASTPRGDVTAQLTWQSTGANTGAMSAALSNGITYSGTYLHVTRQVLVDEYDPFWRGWSAWRPYRRFGGYWSDPWGPSDWPRFATEYSGRVVATLAAPDGSQMRCRFELVRPSSGMLGGGQGECQLPDERVINVVFPRGTTR